MENENFIFYSSWLDAMGDMTEAERGEYLQAICTYATTGVMPECSRYVAGAMVFVKRDVDASLEKRNAYREKQRANIMKRWHGTPDTTEYDGIPRNTMVSLVIPKIPNNSNSNSNSNSEEKTISNDIAKKNTSVYGGTEPTGDTMSPNRFRRPTEEEVGEYITQYARQKGLPEAFTAQAFIDHYESNGWKVGRAPMKDWKAAARSWYNQRKTYGNNKESYRQSNDAAARIIARLAAEERRG